MRESPSVREFAGRCLDQHREMTLTIDLFACEYLDSTFLGCLVGLYRRSHQEPQIQFMVCADRDTVQKLLGSTRLDSIFQCVEASPEPVGPWVELSAPNLEKRDFGLHLLECHQRLSELECPAAPAFKAVAEQLARELSQPPTHK